MIRRNVYKTDGIEKETMLPEERTPFKIYALIMEGLNSAEIASKLNITVKTVKFHKTLLYKKHGVKSVSQLIVKHYKSLLNPMSQVMKVAVENVNELPLGLKL